MDVKLVVVGGAASKHEVRLELPVTVGRADDAGLTIKHPTVSRKHCELFERDGLAMVSDLGSTNGTLVDGVQINEAILRPGEKLTIGPLTFEVVYDLATAAAPVSPPVAVPAAAPTSGPSVTVEDELEIPFDLSDAEPAAAAANPLPSAEDDLLLEAEALELPAHLDGASETSAAGTDDADLDFGSLEPDDDLVVDDFLTAPPAEETATSPPALPPVSAAASPVADEPVFEIPQPSPDGESALIDDDDSLFGDLDLDAGPVEEFADSASGDDSRDSGIGWLTVSGTPPEIEIPLELAADRLPTPETKPAPPAPPPIPENVPESIAPVQQELDFDSIVSDEIEAVEAPREPADSAVADVSPSVEESSPAIPSLEEVEPELMELESLELDDALELPPIGAEALSPLAEPEISAAASADPLAADPWLNIEEGLDLPAIPLDQPLSAEAVESPRAPESSPTELSESAADEALPAAEAGDEWLDELFGIEDGASDGDQPETDEPPTALQESPPALASESDESSVEPIEELGSAELDGLPPIDRGEVAVDLDLFAAPAEASGAGPTLETPPSTPDELDSIELELPSAPLDEPSAIEPEPLEELEPLFADLELDQEHPAATLASPTEAPALPSTEPPAADPAVARSPAAEPAAPEPALPTPEPVIDELEDLFVDLVAEPVSEAAPAANDLDVPVQPPGELEPVATDADSLFSDLDSGPIVAEESPDTALRKAAPADVAPPVAASEEVPVESVEVDLDSADLADLFAEEVSDLAPAAPPAASDEELFVEEASVEFTFPTEPAEPIDVVAATDSPTDQRSAGDFTSPLPATPAPVAVEATATKAGRGWWPFGRKKAVGHGDDTPPSAAPAPEPAPAPRKSKSRALPPLAPPVAEMPVNEEPPAQPRRFFGLFGGGKPKPKAIPVYAPRPPIGGPPPGMPPSGAPIPATPDRAAGPATLPVAAPRADAELAPLVDLADLDLPTAPADRAAEVDQPSAPPPGRNGSAPHAPANDDFASFLDSLDDDK